MIIYFQIILFIALIVIGIWSVNISPTLLITEEQAKILKCPASTQEEWRAESKAAKLEIIVWWLVIGIALLCFGSIT